MHKIFPAVLLREGKKRKQHVAALNSVSLESSRKAGFSSSGVARISQLRSGCSSMEALNSGTMWFAFRISLLKSMFCGELDSRKSSGTKREPVKRNRNGEMGKRSICRAYNILTQSPSDQENATA